MLAQSPPPPSIPCTSEYTGNPSEATVPSGSHPGANATAYLLFDLDSDPTESSPANAASPELVRKYTGILRHFVAGLRRSQVNESKCLGPDD